MTNTKTERRLAITPGDDAKDMLVSDQRIEVEADDQGYAVMTPEQVARHGTDRSERGQRHRVAFTHGLRRGRAIYEAELTKLRSERDELVGFTSRLLEYWDAGNFSRHVFHNELRELVAKHKPE